MSSPIGGSPINPSSRLGDPSQPTSAQMIAQIQAYLNNNDFNDMLQYICSNMDDLKQYLSADKISDCMVDISIPGNQIMGGNKLITYLQAQPRPLPPSPKPPQPTKSQMETQLKTYAAENDFADALQYVIGNFDAIKQAISPDDPGQYMQQIANPSSAKNGIDALIVALLEKHEECRDLFEV